MEPDLAARAETPPPPDYLVIGHLAKDLLEGGEAAAGGTVTYAALAARALGMRVAAVTACAPEDEALLRPLVDAGVQLHVVPSAGTTTFTNRYDPLGRRTQILSALSAPLLLRDVPPAWRGAPLVHLGPIAQEVDATIPGSLGGTLLGITPQGWMRHWDAAGRVSARPMPLPTALLQLPRAACVVMSLEDLGFERQALVHYVKCSPRLVVTDGPGPAQAHEGGEMEEVPAFPTEPVDLTGAGDVFAAALFASLAEGTRLAEAVWFAHAAASLFIGSPGRHFPTRPEVDAFLQERL